MFHIMGAFLQGISYIKDNYGLTSWLKIGISKKVTKGSTLGTMILRFRLEKVSSKKTWATTLLKRWFALMAPWFSFQLFSIVARFSTLDIDSSYYVFHVLIQVFMIFLMYLIIFVLCIHVLIVLLSKKRNYFYFDELTGIVAHYKRNIDEE